MHTHPNARLTPLSRERLLRRHIDHGDPLADLAAQAGISLCTDYKWPARYSSGGATALADARSAATAARSESQAPTLHHQEDCQGRWLSAADRGEGDEGLGPWPPAEPGTQALAILRSSSPRCSGTSGRSRAT